MKKVFTIALLSCFVIACSVSVKKSGNSSQIPAGTYEDTLRYLYSLQPDQWPAPNIDSSVKWTELGLLPQSPLNLDSVQPLILLGKTLFFDTRLSGSNKIACATCHLPELSWADGRSKSVGHEDQLNKRNSPGLLNVWAQKKLFWDGRSNSLEDQAFAPINSETEMHSDMSEVMMKLRRIKGYKPMFQAAFKNGEISPETLATALATFQRTLVGNPSSFDKFLMGDKKALNDSAMRGLHVFRTKAGCMSCHNGPLFTDQEFHNIGLTYYQLPQEDLGRYAVTHKAEDVGRFKTPSLRDVMKTAPWMHNGLFTNMDALMNMYNMGMPQAGSKPANSTDSLFPQTDRLIKPLGLSRREREDLVAFLRSLSAEPPIVIKPLMPQ
ncbi:cytochrome-c peroxidase [Terrimonas sp. NA20]|uniref:Cytochrome-c peroxidase n=1 Tax=Terrimonas ginsenosidimutans TaxID=2908004 RepID=A0ABS9KQJ6_9BACT|nr:cytochrome c peroxidase [Terrimonas ginsenosidimutans]MCG2614599.1 cytochrome-c peroxidase [Terrimonas ginsenosidimutans]